MGYRDTKSRTGVRCPGSKRNNLQAGYRLEVACAERDNVESKLQRSSANNEIRKVDADTSGYLLAVNTSGEPSQFQSEWVNGYSLEKFFHEAFPAVLAR